MRLYDQIIARQMSAGDLRGQGLIKLHSAKDVFTPSPPRDGTKRHRQYRNKNGNAVTHNKKDSLHAYGSVTLNCGTSRENDRPATYAQGEEGSGGRESNC
jgi:hypothetical protein